jgi:hypothetical protein
MDLLRLPVVDAVRFPRDANAFSLEHARDGPGTAGDLDSCAAQPLESLHGGPVHEADARQIEMHRAPRSKEIGALAFQQRDAFRDDVSLELEPRSRGRSLLARDPQRHIDLPVSSHGPVHRHVACQTLARPARRTQAHERRRVERPERAQIGSVVANFAAHLLGECRVDGVGEGACLASSAAAPQCREA